jgi:signal transduction histidine kinase
LIPEAAQAASARVHGKGVDLVSVAEADLPPINADPDRLNQVFANLLDNALRLTPAGGRVSLVARPAQGGVEFEMSDTGAGIASEHLDHVFERFYRVDTARDRAHGGSGIGLAISKALVQAHGGRISARSAGPGQGATFVVWLPRA